ncbi:MAG: UvrB/UvrC motif-containing protein [Planctomycetales bacterium]|nr:UvrB/UvrC motif-containing protein [Planctomycetales bacterium]
MGRRKKHIDDLLLDWPYKQDEVSVRIVPGVDRRDVLQMRVDMGVLQLEVSGRPDGEKPHGYQTYYDYLVGESLHDGADFKMSAEQCNQADREFVQFYHRRIAWLALRRYEEAVLDATHTLELMDFCRRHSPDEDWTMSHEQYRPFVLFHRTQADALAALDDDDQGAERAIHAINQGLERMRSFFVEIDHEESYEEDELVVRLRELRESVRERFSIGRTLHERLADAVASEQYELAAQLRDQLRERH